jgi:hypothetical protein
VMDGSRALEAGRGVVPPGARARAGSACGRSIPISREITRGQVSNVSWSPDGALIYYQPTNGLALEIYSVPMLGGDEHLVLDNAGSAEPLPDGSLIIARPDEEAKAKTADAKARYETHRKEHGC